MNPCKRSNRAVKPDWGHPYLLRPEDDAGTI